MKCYLFFSPSYLLLVSGLFFKIFLLHFTMKILISSIVVILCFSGAYSIKCWVCRSDSDPKCADPFDNSTVPITDCTHEPELPHFPGVKATMCRKIRQKVNGEWRYFRNCAYLGEPGIEGDERFCLMRTGTYNIFMEYCTCNSKDGYDSCEDLLVHKSGSLVELLGSQEDEEEEEQVALEDDKLCDIDKASSQKKKTSLETSDCDNIIDAISEYILKYFIDSIQESELPAHRMESESTFTQSDVAENESLIESHQKHSSINISRMSHDKRSQVISRSSVPEIQDKDKERATSLETESEEDDSRNYFANFKSRDKYVLVEFKNGNIYEGRISRYMMEGKGIYTWKDGTQFEGKFIHGVAQGTGYFLWPNSGWYFGEMKDNMRHGKGICLIIGISQEVCYYGRWKNGQRNGKGILLYGNSNWYDGKWKYDNMHGEGFRLYPTGSYYHGQWKNGQLHGYGTMFWSQGDAYSGFWKREKMHGKGTYVWKVIRSTDFVFPAQNIYEGSYKFGKKHGLGRLLLACGAIISAYWRYDKKEGPGKIICKNGIVIESGSLFLEDKIFDVGEPQDVPEWNKWYYDFLRNYHDGLISGQPVREQSKLLNKEAYKRKARMIQFESQKKLCLNNIPLLAAVDTIPLWKFIEMAASLTPVRDKTDNDIHYMEMEEMANEEKFLRQVIGKRMPDITFLYNHYSKIATEKPPKYDCFLLRIMLWQLCQDCKIEQCSFTLHSLDRKIGYGSYPFDVIPMFEMIYYLLFLAYELCMKKKLLNKKIQGICGAGFDYFITHFALPGTNKTSIVKTICKSLPLNELFSFYNSLGIPVTVKSLMKMYYPKYENGEEEEEEKELPPKNVANISVPLALDGSNLINYDGMITFEYHRAESTSNGIFPQEVDVYTLMSIGEVKVTSCLFEACPKAARRILKERDYEISFLELGQFIINLVNELKTMCASQGEGTVEDCSKGSQLTGIINSKRSGNLDNTKNKSEVILSIIRPRGKSLEVMKDGVANNKTKSMLTQPPQNENQLKYSSFKFFKFMENNLTRDGKFELGLKSDS